MSEDASKRLPRPLNIDFSSQLRPAEPQKLSKLYKGNKCFELSINFNISFMIYWILQPTWLYLGVKSHQKTSKMLSRRPNLVPQTAQEPPKSRPRRLKIRPRAPQEPYRSQPRDVLEPWDSQELPKSRPRATQEPPKSRPDPLRPSILDQFGDEFIPFLVGFSPCHHSIAT